MDFTAKEKLLLCSAAILNKFKKLLAMMASYPNRKENVLKEMAADSLPQMDEPIGTFVRNIQSKINS